MHWRDSQGVLGQRDLGKWPVNWPVSESHLYNGVETASLTGRYKTLI